MCSILSLNFILSSPATTKELPGKSTKAIHAASHYSCASFCGRIVCLTWVAFGFIFFLIHSDKTTKGNTEPLFNLLVPVLPSVSSCHPVVVASLLQPIPPFGVPQVLGPPLVWFMFCLRMSPLLTFLLCLFNVCCIFRPAVSDTFICWTFSFVPCLPENKPLPKKKIQHLPALDLCSLRSIRSRPVYSCIFLLMLFWDCSFRSDSYKPFHLVSQTFVLCLVSMCRAYLFFR